MSKFTEFQDFIDKLSKRDNLSPESKDTLAEISKVANLMERANDDV